MVKVGTRVLTAPDGALDQHRIEHLAAELNGVIESGRRVVLVSSGAVGAGMSQLGLAKRPTNLAKLQAVAAVGQARLIQKYDREFTRHGRHAAQILLTAGDLHDRASYLNVRNTIHSLLEYGAVPVINENDTVAVDELMTTFGDNDHLAALVTNLIRAPLLVILSDVNGLYDGDPNAAGSRVISTVKEIDAQLQSLVFDQTAGVGKGGMASKLKAAKMVVSSGESVIIAPGRREGVLAGILAGEEIGTLILPTGKTASPRKRWLRFSVQPQGRLILDAGARRAIEQRGCSLLAIGVLDSKGEFSKGDLVSLVDDSGNEFARGLTNFTAQEIRRIKGLKTAEIAAALGHLPYDEVIHRDNLAVIP